MQKTPLGSSVCTVLSLGQRATIWNIRCSRARSRTAWRLMCRYCNQRAHLESKLQCNLVLIVFCNHGMLTSAYPCLQHAREQLQKLNATSLPVSYVSRERNLYRYFPNSLQCSGGPFFHSGRVVHTFLALFPIFSTPEASIFIRNLRIVLDGWCGR